jgi:hypothetical protein
MARVQYVFRGKYFVPHDPPFAPLLAAVRQGLLLRLLLHMRKVRLDFR